MDSFLEGANIVYERPDQVGGGGSVFKALAWILQNGVSLESDYRAYDGIPKCPPIDDQRLIFCMFKYLSLFLISMWYLLSISFLLF